jgi:hypothetical protein
MTLFALYVRVSATGKQEFDLCRKTAYRCHKQRPVAVSVPGVNIRPVIQQKPRNLLRTSLYVSFPTGFDITGLEAALRAASPWSSFAFGVNTFVQKIPTNLSVETSGRGNQRRFSC